MFRLFLSFLLIFMGGCRVGPRYEPPSTDAPIEWKNAHIKENCNPVVDYWWEVFNDPVLNELESQAVANNPELYIALERIFEARAIVGIQAANLYPQATLNPSFYDEGILFKAQIPPNLLSNLGGVGAGACGGSSGANTGATIPPFRIHQMQYMLPLNLNYELDLWGRIRDQVDSAFYNEQAQIESYLSVMLSLTSDVASNYFQVRSLEAEINFLKETIATREKNLQLTSSRYSKGLVNFLDVTQAEVDLGNAKANLDESTRLKEIAINQIAVLVGTLPTNFFLDPVPLNEDPPEIPSGVPSTMLLRRPDIAQAERVMASQHAQINAAYANFFPTLSLTGALGFSSPDLKHFLKWISRYWAIGVTSSQMVFDGGRDNSILQTAIARFKEASGGYQQQVLVAFQEVEDALNNIEMYAKQTKNLLDVVNASTKATQLSMNRYVNGVAIYLEVVENERLELQAKINWIRTMSLRYISTIQLIKALGGSWQ